MINLFKINNKLGVARLDQIMSKLLTTNKRCSHPFFAHAVNNLIRFKL